VNGNSPPHFPHQPPWSRFAEFTGGNRFEVLRAVLADMNVPYTVVRLQTNAGAAAHFFIHPASAQQTHEDKVILAAHYDCVPGSPGANDNAASVFILIETATRLLQNASGNWIIILTDKEELTQGESLKEQGAFPLAHFFKNKSDGRGQYYIFDSCGRGDTLIISTTMDYLLKTETGTRHINIQKKLSALRERAIRKAKETMQPFLLLPTPFSDDAGFLRAGLAAQLITVLPASEAAEFAFLARKEPLYINSLISWNHKKNRDQNRFPQTWRIVNTPDDDIRHLNPEHFASVVRFAVALCT
jgi:hypothetical protein